MALNELDALPECPHCGGQEFHRSSMFEDNAAAEPCGTHETYAPDWLRDAREALVADGDYLAFEDGDRVRVVALQDGWTRIGRGMSAHLRFDDPTVSRRHALIHRDGDCARILDDRSLNGVFLNGERVDWHELDDADEIVVGAYHLYFIRLSAERSPAAAGLGTAVG